MQAIVLLAAALAAGPAPAGPDATPLAFLAQGPSETQLLASVLVCYAKDDLASARAAISAEVAASRSRGVADLTSLHEQEARAAQDERTVRAKLEELRERSVQPLSCRRPDVEHLVACMQGRDSVSPRDWCDDSAWRELNERQTLEAPLADEG